MATEARHQGMRDHVLERWRPDILPLLETYARIPNLSPAYEPGWQDEGHMDAAAELLAGWASDRALPGATVEIVRITGLTPTVVVEVPASDPGAVGTVLVYGHYDKQPPFDGWSAGRGPWTPVLEDERLYARGVADDGYALPSALLALEAVAASSSPKAPRRAAVPTCRPCWPTSQTGSAYPTWWWRWTRAAPPTTGCGSPPPSGEPSWERSP
jgi:acetylornithine deacetylase/succinyl-diaminopimelate desuccinylase-like protein